MKMKALSPLFNLFYPEVCACCSTPLLDQENLICLTCQFDLPIVDNGNYKNNLTMKIFMGRVPLERAASFLYYYQSGKAKQLIHELKYQNKQEIGNLIADWFGSQLAKSEDFKDFDCIIPVPLHRKKLKKRGYNQLTKFGKRLGELLQIDYTENLLQRVSFTHTQTKKKRLDRFQNTSSKFVLEDFKTLQNKHVLLIDDVVTTGATLEACCKELLKSDGIKISIATIAITE